jgi:hypothetical protein
MSDIGMKDRLRPLLKALVVVAFLGPCLFGFGAKFVELIHVFRGDADGAFAVAPIMNYLLATTGFLFLLGWAAANGMFHNIEQPKNDMLANESRLDATQSQAR